MAFLFPSGKTALVELLALATDDVAPAIATAGNYVSFYAKSSNFKIDRSRSVGKTPIYGAGDLAASGNASFSISGDLFSGFEAGRVTQITVGTAGTGYTSAPTVTFTGGTGSGASAQAILNSAGGISKIYVTNPGSGYTTTAPTIGFTGGAGTGAAATGFINQYDEAQWFPFFDVDFLYFRISPFGNTAASKKPYYYGTVAMSKFSIDMPPTNILKVSLAGEGSGTLGRGEW